MNERDKIVWIASYPKSGSTWFRVFLSNILTEEKSPKSINDLNITQIASNRVLFDNILGVESSDLTKSEIDFYRPLVYQKLAEDSDTTLFFKVHDAWSKNYAGVPLFPKIVTKAIIYIVRNPLDIVVSFAYHNNIPVGNSIRNLNDTEYSLCSNPNKLYTQLRQVLYSWSEHVVSWTERSGLPCYVLRFEDMIENPMRYFSEALDFLSIKTSESKIISAIEYSSFDKLKEQEKEVGFKEKPLNAKEFFRKGKINDWKNHIGPLEYQRIVSVNRRVMKKYKYYP